MLHGHIIATSEWVRRSEANRSIPQGAYVGEQATGAGKQEELALLLHIRERL